MKTGTKLRQQAVLLQYNSSSVIPSLPSSFFALDIYIGAAAAAAVVAVNLFGH